MLFTSHGAISIEAAAACCDTSMYCGAPPCLACRRPASAATSAKRPLMRGIISPPGRSGSRPGSPSTLIQPLSALIPRSVAA